MFDLQWVYGTSHCNGGAYVFDNNSTEGSGGTKAVLKYKMPSVVL